MPSSNVKITKDNRRKIEHALLYRAIPRAVEDLVDRIVHHGVVHCPISKDVKRSPMTGGSMQQAISRGEPRIGRNEVSCDFGCYHGGAASTEYGSAGRGEPMAGRHPMVASDWPSTPPGKKTYEPYPIKPRNKKALRWESAKAPTLKPNQKYTPGKVKKEAHYAKGVIHPGVRPQPFMRPAIDIVRLREGKRIIVRAVRSEMKKVVGEVFDRG